MDLVILDLMLPGMSGYAVCEAPRAAEKHVPVLILSARTAAEDRTRGFDVGADQYRMKLFDLDEFLSRVRNLLTLHSRRAGLGSKRTALDQFIRRLRKGFGPDRPDRGISWRSATPAIASWPQVQNPES